MFRFIVKKAAFWLSKSQIKDNKKEKDQNELQRKLSKNLKDNIAAIKTIMGGSSDVVVREFCFGPNQCISAALIFIDGLSDTKIINESIIEPLMYKSVLVDEQYDFKDDSIKHIETAMLSVSEVERADDLNDAIDGFLYGDVLLMIDGANRGLIINCKGWDKRNIGEPSGETVVRGPRESFTENLRTSTSLLRRKIKNPSLMMESMKLGKKTGTDVCIVYIKGLANPELIQEVKERLAAINIDSILESGYIEQYIEDSPSSIFATIGNTEKPDVVAAKILEGRVAIIVDGTPFVLTAPYLFIEGFQTAEDYYFRPYYMSLLRITRYIAYAITVMAPAIYVAVTTFHRELIPTDLLYTMAKAREGIPFSAFAESVIMLLTFEILREAGIRLPRPVGQALSIVGALVIGQAAVSAGLIGTPMVIVISITAVSVFVIPSQADSAAILRLILLVLAATLGGFGITIGLLGTLVHLASLESFGVPYLSPLVPFESADLKDTLIRAPLWLMTGRPKGMSRNDKKRREYLVPPAGNSHGGDK